MLTNTVWKSKALKDTAPHIKSAETPRRRQAQGNARQDSQKFLSFLKLLRGFSPIPYSLFSAPLGAYN